MYQILSYFIISALLLWAVYVIVRLFVGKRSKDSHGDCDSCSPIKDKANTLSR